MDEPDVAVEISNAIAGADEVPLKVQQDFPRFFELTAEKLKESGHGTAATSVRKAALRLCARAMEGRVRGIVGDHAAEAFADVALTLDNKSIRGAAQSALGEDEGDKAFRRFSRLLSTRETVGRGMYPRLEAVTLRVPEADIQFLDPKLAQFWRLRSPAGATARVRERPADVRLPEQLIVALQKYLEVPYEAKNAKGISENERQLISEGYVAAHEYLLRHPDEPWAEYLASFGQAILFRKPTSGLNETIGRLPEKQSGLARRLALAAAKGTFGFEERDEVLVEMWQDFRLLAKAQDQNASDGKKPKSVAELFQELEDKHRSEAETLVPKLRKALLDQDAHVRRKASEELALISFMNESAKRQIAKEAIPELRKALADRDRLVRKNVVGVLYNLGAAAKDAVPELRKALKDEDSLVRDAAALALKAIEQ